MQSLQVEVPGAVLHGAVEGSPDGVPLLMLHGGPGISDDYLEPLIDEFVDGYSVARYRQRGVSPSTGADRFDIGTQCEDAVAVLDALGWQAPVVLGHSWGGHLLLHLLIRHPSRVRAAVVVDSIGGVGDGGVAEFQEKLLSRMPEDLRLWLQDLDRREAEGTFGDAEMLEQLRRIWPYYFADPATAPAASPDAASVAAASGTWESILAELPSMAGRLAAVRVPTMLIHPSGSPIPLTASSATAAVLGSAARLTSVEGAGHLPWFERPGELRRLVDAFLAGLPSS